MVLAVTAAVCSHNLKRPAPIPNLYSAHSWLGCLVIVLFGLQVSRLEQRLPTRARPPGTSANVTPTRLLAPASEVCRRRGCLPAPLDSTGKAAGAEPTAQVLWQGRLSDRPGDDGGALLLTQFQKTGGGSGALVQPAAGRPRPVPDSGACAVQTGIQEKATFSQAFQKVGMFSAVMKLPAVLCVLLALTGAAVLWHHSEAAQPPPARRLVRIDETTLTERSSTEQEPLRVVRS